MGKRIKPRKISAEEQRAIEAEIMNKPINPSGEGELPAVQALLDEDFLKISDFKATDIALMLQHIIRGQNSLIARAEDNAAEINRLKEKMANNDALLEKRFGDQTRDIQGILDQSSKLKAVGSAKDKIVAIGAQQFQAAVREARVSNSLSKKQFEEAIKRQPTVQVISPGIWENVREGQSVIPKIRAEEIRIKHLVWYLPPGVPTMVPKAVADQLAARRASEQETELRKTMLSKQMEQSKLVQAWNAVGGSKTESLPIA